MHNLNICNFPGYFTHSNCMDDFAAFVADRRGMSLDKAWQMIATAQGIFNGGWGGDEYRDFTVLLLETLRPIYDDTNDRELIETYKHHGDVDFLRMLSYPVPKHKDLEAPLRLLADKKTVEIVDYGCGMAQRTIALAKHLVASGKRVKLYQVDIRKEIFREFLGFVCRKYNIETEYIEITAENLYPELPQHDYCDNVSVLEHIREPLRVIDNTHRGLRPGGLFLAGAGDARVEMMHISPNLQACRMRLNDLGYQVVGPGWDGAPLLQKPL